MSLEDYIEVYDILDQEENIDNLRSHAKYLLVGRAMNDDNLSEDEAIALAQYASCDMRLTEEGIVIH